MLPLQVWSHAEFSEVCTVQSVCQSSRVLEMDCPKVQSYLGSHFDFLFVARVMEINCCFLWVFHGPTHFDLLVFSRFLAFNRLVQVLVLTVRGFPLWSFDFWENGLAARWLPSSPTLVVSIKVRKAPSPCARKVTSPTPSRITTPKGMCRELWLYHLLGPRFLLLPNLDCRKMLKKLWCEQCC